MLKNILLATTFSTVLADYVHDLDDEDHLADIKSTGINLSNVNKEAFLKVSSNQSTGYSWIVDYDDCEDILDITSGYVTYEDDDSSFPTGAGGEEVFTLTAVGYGDCDFTIAYARVWEFKSFRDHKNSNGYTISVPINVITQEETDQQASYDAWDGKITNGDQSGWIFGEGDVKGNVRRDRSHYIWFGAFSWIRSITLLGAFGWLPTAIAQARLNRYNIQAAPKLMWLIKWWSHIAGLSTTFLNLTLAGFMIGGSFSMNNEENCDSDGKNRRSRYSLYTDCEYWSNTTWDIIGVWVITWELLGTWAYYFYRKGAYRYTAYIYDAECENYGIC